VAGAGATAERATEAPTNSELSAACTRNRPTLARDTFMPPSSPVGEANGSPWCGSSVSNRTRRAARTGWLGALQDQQIGQAIVAVHRNPGHPWTVASLASQAAMSRSAFAARFTQLVGEPAVQYLTRWRMHLALACLQQGPTTIRELATQFGYGSEAAFSHAFKRVIGVSPGAVRHRSEHPEPAIDGPLSYTPGT
jgi:AraC-like DNA-binding protein